MSLDALERNPALWKTDDKQWVAERKKEWALIQYRLAAVTDLFAKKSWKHLKRYFMTGDIPYPAFEYLNGDEYERVWRVSDVVMQIWLYPVEPTLSDIKIPEKWRFNFDYGRTDFYRNCHNLIRWKIRNEDTGEYGAMGGREKLISAYLNPGLDFREQYRFSENIVDNACLDPFEVLSKCIGSTRSELNDYSVSKAGFGSCYVPFSLGNYLWDHLDYALEKYPLGVYEKQLIDKPERLSEDEFISAKKWSDENLRQTLVNLLEFSDREPNDQALQRATTVAFVEDLVTRYERREFTDAMLARWDDAKLSIGR